MAAFLDHRVNHRVIFSWRGLVQGSGVPTGSNSGKMYRWLAIISLVFVSSTTAQAQTWYVPLILSGTDANLLFQVWQALYANSAPCTPRQAALLSSPL